MATTEPPSLDNFKSRFPRECIPWDKFSLTKPTLVEAENMFSELEHTFHMVKPECVKIITVDTLDRKRIYASHEFRYFWLNNDTSWNLEDKYQSVTLLFHTYSIIYDGNHNIVIKCIGEQGYIK